MNNLSIVIIGKDNEGLYEECIDECLKLSKDVFYIDPGLSDTNINTATGKGIAIVNNVQELQELCTSPWTLFLNSNEKPAVQDGFRIDKSLTDKSVKGYSLLVKKNYEHDVLDSFQWLKMNNQYKNLNSDLMYTSIEIRLVHHDDFRQFLQFFIGESHDGTASWNSKVLRGIEIIPCSDRINQHHQETETGISDEIKYLTGERSFNPDKDDEMPELSDDYIIYSVLTQKDVERYYRGLEKGFGGDAERKTAELLLNVAFAIEQLRSNPLYSCKPHQFNLATIIV